MRVTIKHVAKQAGVSTATVSYVLNNTNRVSSATRAKVLSAIEDLGYYPNAMAQGLVKNQTKTIGLVIPHTADYVFSDPYFPELLRGVGRVLSERGYFLLLSLLNHEAQFTDMCSALITQRRVDGVIMVCSPRENLEVTRLQSSDIPFVLIGANQLSEVSSVDVDNEEGSYTVTKHLLSLGHKRIGYITGDMRYDYSVLRYRGYSRALEEEGSIPSVYMGDFTRTSGGKGLEQILAQNPSLTAIVCANDLMAIGAITKAKALGYGIPGDLSIAGFDDIPIASEIKPSLTTIRQPIAELGVRASQQLINMLESDGEKHRSILPTQLVVRDSTAPPP